MTCHCRDGHVLSADGRTCTGKLYRIIRVGTHPCVDAHVYRHARTLCTYIHMPVRKGEVFGFYS